MRKLVLIVAFGALAVCTPEQHQAWLAWHDDDPTAAEEWVRTECGALCTDDWDQDGVVEPEPDVEAEAPESSPADPEVEADYDDGGAYWPWNALAECESGGDWHISTGNGYYGGLQFSLSSWQAVGGSGYPHENSMSEQIHRGELLRDAQGWGAWPSCSAQLGL